MSTINTTAKLRAIKALCLPAARVMCDNGDNTTYYPIAINTAMEEWVNRHPEASVPDFGKDRPTAASWRYGLRWRMIDARRRALQPGYPFSGAARRQYHELLTAVVRYPFRPTLP